MQKQKCVSLLRPYLKGNCIVVFVTHLIYLVHRTFQPHGTELIKRRVPEESFAEEGEHIWPPIQYVPNLHGNMGSDGYLWADFWA